MEYYMAAKSNRWGTKGSQRMIHATIMSFI